MIKAPPLPLIALALSLSVAACADMDWTRPGADKAAVSQDLDACRGIALGRSQPANPIRPEDTVSRSQAPTRPAGSSNERFIAQHEDVSRCMSGKGYRL